MNVVLQEKLKAALIHLAVCGVIAALVLCLVFFAWYPGLLSRLQGVGTILLIVLIADVTIGPLLTLVVYKRGKKSLKMDLAIIALIQLVFLAYGLYTIEIARPAYLIFVKDRLEVVSRSDWPKGEALKASPSAAPKWFSPKLIAAKGPEDSKEKLALILDSAAGGPDIHHLPKYYVEYKDQLALVSSKLLPLAKLEELNIGREKEISSAIAGLNISQEKLGFLPLRARQGDAAALVLRSSGEIVDIWPFAPWK